MHNQKDDLSEEDAKISYIAKGKVVPEEGAPGHNLQDKTRQKDNKPNAKSLDSPVPPESKSAGSEKLEKANQGIETGEGAAPSTPQGLGEPPPSPPLPLPPPSLVVTTDQIREPKDLHFGSFSSLPVELTKKKLGYLNPQDTSRLSTTSVGASSEVAASAREHIKMLMEHARFLNKEINRLTEGKMELIGSNEASSERSEVETRTGMIFFKFDIKKWEQVIEDIDRAYYEGKTVVNSTYLENECRLDLVEALAEFNVERFHILNDKDNYDEEKTNYVEKKVPMSRFAEKGWTQFNDERKLHEFAFQRENRFINLLFKESELSTLSPSLVEILDEAKQSFKVSLQINQCLGFGECRDGFNFFKNVDHVAEGPYFKIILTSCEVAEEGMPAYRKATVGLQGRGMHFDWLAGKKQGDRIVMPPRDDKSEQLVIRLNQTFEGTLEEKVIAGICSGESDIAGEVKKLDKQIAKTKDAQEKKRLNQQIDDIGAKNLARRRQIFRQLEEAYGKESVDKIRKNWKIETFHKEWRIPIPQ